VITSLPASVPERSRVRIGRSRRVLAIQVAGRRSPASVDRLCWGIALFVGGAGTLFWVARHYPFPEILRTVLGASITLCFAIAGVLGAMWAARAIRRMNGVAYVGLTRRHLIVRSRRPRERLRLDRGALRDVFVRTIVRGQNSTPKPGLTISCTDGSETYRFDEAHPGDLFWLAETLRSQLGFASARTRRLRWIAQHAHWRGTAGFNGLEFVDATRSDVFPFHEPFHCVQVYIPHEWPGREGGWIRIGPDELLIKSGRSRHTLACDSVYAFRIEGGGENGPECLRLFSADAAWPVAALTGAGRPNLSAVIELLTEALLSHD
jgi:hypothetical protein